MPLRNVKMAATVIGSAAVAAIAIACSDDAAMSAAPAPGNGSDAAAPASAALTRASHGSALDISEDDRLLVSVNRDVGSISVFDVVSAAGNAPVLTKRAEVPTCTGAASEVVLSASGDHAFVLCREEQKIVRVDGLRGSPAKGPAVAVGSEPTGVALAGDGSHAWVANFADGTAMEIDTSTMTVSSTVDLNGTLAATGTMGAVTGRPGLAHPRSVAITNDAVLVTEFFGQQTEALRADGSNADTDKEGLVYRIGLADRVATAIALPPIADIGVHDHADNVAGCYPNQVLSLNVQGGFAYVLSICASAKGPFGDYGGPAPKPCGTDDALCPGGRPGSCDSYTKMCRSNCTTDAGCGLGGTCDTTTNSCVANSWDAKSLVAPAVSIIDLATRTVVGSAALNAPMETLFTSLGTADTEARRLPLHAMDLAFVPGTTTAYVPAKGADAVFKMTFDPASPTKPVSALGASSQPFIALDRGSLGPAKQGKLPIAMTVAHGAKLGAQGRYGFVLNDASRNVTVIDLDADEIAGFPTQPVVTSSADMPTDATDKAALEGRRLFETGLGRWSRKGQAWVACESCHWDGLSDQVTWFFFDGPRQSPSLDQTYDKKDPAIRRIQNWAADVDEVQDHEGAIRHIMGGVGAAVKSPELTNASRIAYDANGQAGLSGSMIAAVDSTSPSSLVKDVCVLDDWKELALYMARIRTPRAPSNLDKAKVAAGLQAFADGKCAGCHGGNQWTVSRMFYTPDPNVASATNVNVALQARSWGPLVTTAKLPTNVLPTTIAASQTMRTSGADPTAQDQLICALRQVGTFDNAEPGVGIAELKQNMMDPAQDNLPYRNGFNVPSLLGAAVNGPYFHAGNARTLEAVLSPTFAAHNAALATAFLAGDAASTAATREALVHFLLSIDPTTTPIPTPALGAGGGSFCVAP